MSRRGNRQDGLGEPSESPISIAALEGQARSVRSLWGAEHLASETPAFSS